MRSHRLARLALLTKGAALVSLGAAAIACSKDQPITNAPDPNLHINAPPDPTPSTTAATSAAPEPIHINAPPSDPQQHPHANATATPPSAKPDPQAPTSALKPSPSAPVPPIRTNSPPR